VVELDRHGERIAKRARWLRFTSPGPKKTKAPKFPSRLLAERTGLEDAANATPRRSTRGEGALRLVHGAPSVTEQHGAPSVPVTADRVAAELEGALVLRRSGAEAKTLRRALRRIEELLDE
jgi:hypothetical protein